MKCPYCGCAVEVFLPAEPGIGVPMAKCRHCGHWIDRPFTDGMSSASPVCSVVIPAPEAGSVPDPDQFKKHRSSRTDIEKYFLHGLSFSIIMIGITVGWVLILAFLIAVGSFIGLIAGLALLVYIIGWLNVELTKYFWHYDAGSEWMGLIWHGTFLLLALLAVSIPQLVLSSIIPGFITAIVLFVAYCFVDGFVARSVARVL